MAKKHSYIHREKKRKKRKGIHAKSKMSKSKNATNYFKRNRGQGR